MPEKESEAQQHLVILPKGLTPAMVFTTDGAVDKAIDHVKKAVKEFEADVETPEGRKEITSMAYKVARSKTFLDKAGKEEVAGIKAKAKKIDAGRKRFRDACDAIKAEVRAPLDEWEAAEKERLDHEAMLMDWDEAIEHNELLNAKLELDRLKAKEEADRLKAEREERRRQQLEEEERLRKIREKEIAEQAVQAEKEKAAVEAEAAKKAQEDADRRHKEALEQAERDKEAAIKAAQEEERRKAEQAEAARIAKEEAEKAEAERLAKDEAHQKKVNSEALRALQLVLRDARVDERAALIALEAIWNGKIPHVTINY